MRFLLFILICAGLLLTAESCKKECQDRSNPDCENYDPCYGKQKLTADFDIYEASGFYTEKWTPHATDTILPNAAIFMAKDDDVWYSWQIGAETLDAKSVYRNDFPLNTPVPITLTVRRRNNFNCFANGDSVATKTKSVYVFANPPKLRYFGCFSGYHTDNPTDTFTVCIKYNDSFDVNSKFSSITGLINDGGCLQGKLFLRSTQEWGYRQLYFFENTITCGYYPEGTIRADSVNYDDVYINYTIKKDDNLNNRPKRTFIGKRIK